MEEEEGALDCGGAGYKRRNVVDFFGGAEDVPLTLTGAVSHSGFSASGGGTFGRSTDAVREWRFDCQDVSTSQGKGGLNDTLYAW